MGTVADLSNVVDLFATEITIHRYATVYLSNGRKIDTPEIITFKLDATVAPATPKQLQRLPEGTRAEATIAIYSREPLYTVRTSKAKQADQVTYKCVKYQIHEVEDWFELGNYYVALAVRLER